MNYNMSLSVNSGSEISDKIGILNISGNITPALWYKTITRENGKPYLLAIAILSDIVYWYKPSEVRDEISGQLIGWKKKFRGDMLQKTYQQYADLFGESKRSVKAAMDRLEELGIIKKIFRDEMRNGHLVNNIMYIYVDVDMLYRVTFTEHQEINENTGKQEYEENIGEDKDIVNETAGDLGVGSDESIVSNNSDITGPFSLENLEKKQISSNRQAADGVVQNNVPPSYKIMYAPPTKFCTTLPQNNVHPPAKFCTHTKNTIKNNAKITYNQSIKASENEIDRIDSAHAALIQKLKDNLEYDLRISGSDADSGLFHDAFMTMCDVILADSSSTFRINGMVHTQEDVKNRMLSLDYAHVMYAVHQTASVPMTNVTNARSYLIAALYNSVNTMNIAISQHIVDKFYY